MSRADYDREADALRAALGVPFELLAATNSLKLTLDDDHRHLYLWVDPPWVLEDDGGHIVVDSAECPRETESFRKWAGGLLPIRRSVAIRALSYEEGTGATLELSNGWRLRLYDGIRDPLGADSWYDDFYWRADRR